jgi:hypothetical protein
MERSEIPVIVMIIHFLAFFNFFFRIIALCHIIDFNVMSRWMNWLNDLAVYFVTVFFGGNLSWRDFLDLDLEAFLVFQLKGLRLNQV